MTRCAAVVVFAYLVLGLDAACAAAAGGEPQVASEPAVKLSRSGICYDRTSPNYRQLKTYDPYASIEECLAAGGRLPDGTRALPSQPRTANPAWWESVDWGYWAGTLVVVIVAWPLLSRWRARRRMRGAFRSAEDRARRQWEGHRLDRRGPDRRP